MEIGLIVALAAVVACGVILIRKDIRQQKARAKEVKAKELELKKQQGKQELRELRLVQNEPQRKKGKRGNAKLKAGA